jgi:hypothetical protein
MILLYSQGIVTMSMLTFSDLQAIASAVRVRSTPEGLRRAALTGPASRHAGLSSRGIARSRRTGC